MKLLKSSQPRKNENPTKQILSFRKYSRTPKGRYAHLKYVAKRDGLEFTLTLEQYQQLDIMPCFYECGNEKAKVGYGLDKLDPDQGYTLDNVVACCPTCNSIKGSWWSWQEMLTASRAVNALREQVAQEKAKD